MQRDTQHTLLSSIYDITTLSLAHINPITAQTCGNIGTDIQMIFTNYLLYMKTCMSNIQKEKKNCIIQCYYFVPSCVVSFI